MLLSAHCSSALAVSTSSRRRFKSARLKTQQEAHMAKKSKKKVAKGKKLPSIKTLKRNVTIEL